MMAGTTWYFAEDSEMLSGRRKIDKNTNRTNKHHITLTVFIALYLFIKTGGLCFYIDSLYIQFVNVPCTQFEFFAKLYMSDTAFGNAEDFACGGIDRDDIS
jgi:type III secretory pathway component EscT